LSAVVAVVVHDEVMETEKALVAVMQQGEAPIEICLMMSLLCSHPRSLNMAHSATSSWLNENMEKNEPSAGASRTRSSQEGSETDERDYQRDEGYDE